MQFKTLSAILLGGACVAATEVAPYPLSYDETWAGPVRLADKFNTSTNATGFTMAEATLVMPRLSVPKKPYGTADLYTASFWVGLDGFLSTTNFIRGLWQAGVIMSVWPNGTTQYSGFYEWIPEDPVDLSANLSISEGDHIYVQLNTTNNGYQGTVTLKNLNTSQVYSLSRDAPTKWRGPTFPSQGATAEWIIEAGTYLNGPQYIFPDWGTAYFLGARACYDGGECAVAGDGTEDQGHYTAMLWNDTQTLYTRSSANGDLVSIEYVEEAFTA